MGRCCATTLSHCRAARQLDPLAVPEPDRKAVLTTGVRNTLVDRTLEEATRNQFWTHADEGLPLYKAILLSELFTPKTPVFAPVLNKTTKAGRAT